MSARAFGRPAHLEPHQQPRETTSSTPETGPPADGDDPLLADTGFEFRLGEDTPLPSGDPLTLADARHLRDVLGRFCTGVTVVTSMSDGEPVGMTCQSFSSVSLSPPLVLFCPAKASGTWPTIERAGFFCVNVLADGQQEISTRMATTGVARFDGIPWSQSGTGAPLLDGILGYVD